MKKSLAALALLATVGCAAQAGDRIALGPLAPGMSLAEVARVFPGAALKCLEVQGKTVCGYSVAAENVQPLVGERVLRWDLILDDDHTLDFVLAELGPGSFERVTRAFGERYGAPVEARDDERGVRVRMAWDGGDTAMAVMRMPKGTTLAVLTSHPRLETFVANVQGSAGIRRAANGGVPTR